MSVYSLDFRAHSETGLVRKNNQDSVLASPTALVVADGMGGAAAGDLASAIAIHEIARADARLRDATRDARTDGGTGDPAATGTADAGTTDPRPTEPGSIDAGTADGAPSTAPASDEQLDGDDMLGAFAIAVTHANDLISDLVAEAPVLDGMGTTVCGGFFNGTQLGIVHIGDSRGYLLRDGRLTRLSHDHSWVQSLVDDGRLHEADMSTHPHRSLLLRVLNGQDADPDTSLVDVQLGDRLLFCSDGLCGFTTDAEIGRLMALDNLEDAVAGLIQAAHAGGGADNITFALATVVPHSDELAARAPVQLGAVADGDLADILAMATQTPNFPAPLDAPRSSVPAGERHERDAYELDPDEREALRYAPTRHRRRWLPTVALLTTVGVVVGAAGVGGLLYSRSQYYVGVAPAASGASVAIFRGLPDNVLGLRLSSLQQVESTLVSDLPGYYRQQVESTIGSDSLAGARQTAQQLAAMAQQCVALRQHAAAPTTTASASPSASASTRGSASTSASRSASGRAHPSASTRPGRAASSASPSARTTTATLTPGPSAASGAATAAPTVPTTGALTLQDCS